MIPLIVRLPPEEASSRSNWKAPTSIIQSSLSASTDLSTMDQFKVQAALSNMVTPVTSSFNSTESEMQQQPSAPDGATSGSSELNQGKDGERPDALDLSKQQGQDRGGSQHHPVAEFLYQLTKMLTDDNSEIIEWVDGRIKVHHPERLEAEVLHKYFRHSKFASFQRQLNYFGFRKIAGKGKMSPCSYVNESATSDIRSLLLIKRKTNGSAARKAMAQRALSLSGGMNPALGTGLPGLTGAHGGLQGGQASLSALNQFQMQKQLGAGLYNNENLSQLLAQNQQQHSWNDLQQLGGLKPNMPSIEQLQAQLANLSKQQNQGGASAALNAAAFNLASNGGNFNFSQYQSSESPATAALNSAPSSMPATAAMNAASAAAGQSNNLFESATNLKSLLGNDQSGNESQQNTMGGNPGGRGQNLFNRLPSSNGMFPGNVSNASLGNLLASSNRLSSLLSLNSFLSREPSLADLAMMPNGAQLAALGVQQNQQEMANRFNHQNTA
jgi:hypothetical protein